MLSRYLEQTNCQVYHSTADADLLIVNKAVERSRTMDNVLVGDDTELLILLCYHAEWDVLDLFFQPEPKANSTKRRSWNIKSVKEKLGQEICRHILFIHAISGCDRTSRLYGIASYHNMRVYHPVIQWKGKEEQVPAEEWGWRLNDDGQLVPIMTRHQKLYCVLWGATACLIVVACDAHVKNMILSVQLHVDTVEAPVALMLQQSISTKS